MFQRTRPEMADGGCIMRKQTRGITVPPRRVFNFSKYTPKHRRMHYLRKHYKRNPVSGNALRWAVMQCHKARLNAKEIAGVLSIPIDEASWLLGVVKHTRLGYR